MLNYLSLNVLIGKKRIKKIDLRANLCQLIVIQLKSQGKKLLIPNHLFIFH